MRTIAICFTVCLISINVSLAAANPNIVVILADDLGWADVSYHGGVIKTPTIDRLAKEGIELDRFYVCPMCSPTRAALLTGRYPIRFGLARAVIPPWRRFGLDTKEATMPSILEGAGYKARGIFGKWHLGHLEAKWHPLRRGFTHFRGHYNGAIDYFTHLREGERDWHVGYEPSDQQGYTTDLIADAACEFIKKHADDGPLFCYIPFNSPHSPFQAPEKYLAQNSHIDNKHKRTLAAMISCLDDAIGRVLDTIDEAGIKQNTLVWFMSDNGGIRAVKDNNLPLRGNKLDVFEGGVRVPACIRWPAKLQGGRRVTAPLSCMDVLPTLQHIVGLKAADNIDRPLDGLDVYDVLTGKQTSLDRDLFFYHGQAGPMKEKIALTTPKWKLVIHGPDLSTSAYGEKHSRWLFRIDADPNEKQDVAAQFPEIVRRMTDRIAEFRKLQPAHGVVPYGRKDGKFVPPKDWRVVPK